MDKKHVHYDMIEEWARTGKEVQMFDPATQKWVCCDPCWNPNVQYRFKPDTLKYKRYIARSSDGKLRVFNAHPNTEFNCQSGRLNFIRWIDTEWQEAEV